MPGKQKRDGSKPLTRQQAKVAGNILRPHFDPSRGEKQFNEKTKRELVRAVNEKFAQDGQDAVYTVRKLEDWVRATRRHRGRALAAAHARLTTARAGLQRDLQVAVGFCLLGLAEVRTSFALGAAHPQGLRLRPGLRQLRGILIVRRSSAAPISTF